MADQKFSRGALYLMLQNRIYRGEITHKGNAYPGEHPAIIEKPLWDQVQAALAVNRVERATGARAKQPSLLGGMIFDETGGRLTPTYSIKKGTRYRYYVSTSLITGTAKDHANGRRIPAANLESLVIQRLRTFLADQGAVLDAIQDEYPDGTAQRRMIDRGREMAEELGTPAQAKVKATLMMLLSRVDVRSDGLEITIRRSRLVDLLAGQSIDPAMHGQPPRNESDDVLTLTVTARLKRVGREMRMIVENADDQTAADPSLLRIIARAHDIQERLIQNTDLHRA